MQEESIFSLVKRQVDMRRTAELYGFAPNRAGFICCPFHGEKTPSCKLYPERFYCFGCGKHGDAVGFVSMLKEIPPYEAAKDLARTAGIVLPERSGRRKPEPKPGLTASQRRELWLWWERKTYRTLKDYKRVLMLCRREFAPKVPGEEPYPLFTKALETLPFLEFALGELTKPEAERKAFLLQFREECDRLCSEYKELIACEGN